jgi:hypothetical protein
MRQGRVLPEAENLKIVRLLRSTDLTLTEIAARMFCSRSYVAGINRRYGVRIYSGHRTTWEVRQIEEPGRRNLTASQRE